MELSLAVSPGELTRAEQKILDYINTNTDAFFFPPSGSWPSAWGFLTPQSPGLPATQAVRTLRG